LTRFAVVDGSLWDGADFDANPDEDGGSLGVRGRSQEISLASAWEIL
jgi:hypothetical protein